MYRENLGNSSSPNNLVAVSNFVMSRTKLIACISFVR